MGGTTAAGYEVINPAMLMVMQQPLYAALGPAARYAETVDSQLAEVQLDLHPIIDCIYTLHKLALSDGDKRYFQNLLDKANTIMVRTTAVITAPDVAPLIAKPSSCVYPYPF